MRNVLTLVAAQTLDTDLPAAAAARLAGRGARVGAADWLAPDQACDIPFDGLDPGAAMALCDDLPVDVFAQPAAGRRKKLLIADMDSTIVTGETLDELSAFAGVKDQVAAITAQAMDGVLDFEQALDARVGLLEGLPAVSLDKTWAAIAYTPGAAVLVATMRAHGARTALVSGGFDFFTGRVRAELGFDYHQANRLEIVDGVLSGRVHKPVLDRQAKRAALARLCDTYGLAEHETLAVGDGANDLPMLLAAGAGVAFHAKPSVRRQARLRVDHGDLSALLYLQGYRRSAFVTDRG